MKRMTKRVGVNEAILADCDFDFCEPFIRAGFCKTGMQGGFPRRWERHCNDSCVLGMLIDRLADIEDVFGEEYDLNQIRELLEGKA